MGAVPNTNDPQSGSRPAFPTVAMVGGGQLARMTHQAAIGLGQRLRVLAVDTDEPAAQVSPDVVIGSHTDFDALRRVAAGAAVLTFDHEHVPQELLDKLAADRITIAPPPQALRYAQDKLAMRRRLTDMGVAVPQWTAVTAGVTGESGADIAVRVDEFLAGVDGAAVVKASRGGYDGRGVIMTDNAEQTREAVAQYLSAGMDAVLEERVSMRRELAALVARSPFGQGAAWPVVQTVQHDGICVQVIAPAPNLTDDQAGAAQQLALRIAAELGVTGVLAVELFETHDGELLVNELAMRPHNSGHWTMDAGCTSQFEQHLRAVLDYPLGDTAPTAPLTVMTNVLGAARPVTMAMDERLHHLFAAMPDARVHLYGKTERPGRKIGHVNLRGDDREAWREVARRAAAAAHWLASGQWPDVIGEGAGVTDEGRASWPHESG